MIQVTFIDSPFGDNLPLIKGPFASIRQKLEYLCDDRGTTIAVWDDPSLRWCVYHKGGLHYYSDFLISEVPE